MCPLAMCSAPRPMLFITGSEAHSREFSEDAYAKAAQPKELTYDLILMDVQMPIMNGYQAPRAIRALDDAVKAAIPIVAMTANAFEEDRKEAMDSGLNVYVAKPIDIEKLMQTLEDILR